MTSTSGPGISLMSEYAGLAHFAEVPIVIWDVQRMGPSTGLPTRTAQGDFNGCILSGPRRQATRDLAAWFGPGMFRVWLEAFDLASACKHPSSCFRIWTWA